MPRVDPVLVVAVAALGGALGVVAPLATGLTALGLVAVLARRVSPAVLALAALAGGASGLRAHHAVGRYERARLEARDGLGGPARCSATGTVAASPTVSGGSTALLLDLDAPECEGRTLSRQRVRVHGGPEDLARGDRVAVVVGLAPVQLFRNLELSDPTPRAARRGVVASGSVLALEVIERARGPFAVVDRARAAARGRILATFAPEAAPLARALVLGESDLDPADDEAFRKSGLSHLLAVSGTHLVFAVLVLVRALGALLACWSWLALRVEPRRLAAAVGAPLSLAYADFAGGSGSAWRAAFMLAPALFAVALGRRAWVARAVALSVLLGVATDPLAAFDVSFLLSLAATTGLVVLGAPLVEASRRLPGAPLRWLAQAIAATVASMAACTPLLSLLGPEVTLAGLAANVVAGPLGEAVALPACLTHAVTAWWPAAEQGLALLGSGALLAVKHVAHWSAAQRWAAFELPPPSSWQLGVLVLGGVAAWLLQCRVAVVAGALCAFGVLELAARHEGAPRGALRVTVLDVGQGDALLVDLPDGRLMLVDGGGVVGSPVDPGRQVVLPVLRERRRRRIDVAVLSHPHPDHFLGLASALRAVEVGELWDTGQGEAEGAGPVYRQMLADLRARGVPVRRPAELCGREHGGAGLRLRVLGPCPTFTAGRNANDSSLVLHLRFGVHAALLTGDAEEHQERELSREHGAALAADFLKSGHHGSRTSSTEPFLAHVRPRWVTVSSGVRNPHGHPHAEAMQRLATAGAEVVARIDRGGAARFETDGRSARFATARAPR